MLDSQALVTLHRLYDVEVAVSKDFARCRLSALGTFQLQHVFGMPACIANTFVDLALAVIALHQTQSITSGEPTQLLERSTDG